MNTLLAVAVLSIIGLGAGLLVTDAAAAPTRKTIELRSGEFEIGLVVGDDQRLYQYHLGKPGMGRQPDKVPVNHYDRAADRQSEVYPAFGNGFLCEPALQVRHPDGNTSTDLVYVSHSSEVAGGVTITRIDLKDGVYPLFVTLWYKTYGELGVIETWAEIRNGEAAAVELERFASAAPVLQAREYHLTQLHGYHMREGTVVEEKLAPGIKVLDSKLGVRAHQMRTPVFGITLNQPAATAADPEAAGETILGTLKWPGSFQFAFEVDWENRLRVLAGINPFAASYKLAAGKSFTTPSLVLAYSGQGKGDASRKLHRWAMTHAVREPATPRPVLLNNWEATYFNFDQAKIISLMDGAKEIGIETFLLDDGWFGGKYPRDSDRIGLGDWDANSRKLPGGLAALVAAARERGIEFGIWLEPEMVSPKSELYEKHPEWALQQPGREMILGRWQRVLDLNRPEVRDFVYGIFERTLAAGAGTGYIKWDCNAYALQPGSTFLPADQQSHALIEYQWHVLDLMSRVHRSYPQVKMMLCSSGPARADYASLAHFHSFWTSDNTDPVRRVFIQWGFSHFYPAAVMSAHVTDMGKRPLKFACDVALSGAFGIDLDLAKHSAQDRATLARAVELYKSRLRPLTAEADLYRLESPYAEPRGALMYVSQDKREAAAFVYQLKDNATPKNLMLRGLDATATYRIEEVNLAEGSESVVTDNGKTRSGAELMTNGLMLTLTKAETSSVIFVTRTTN